MALTINTVSTNLLNQTDTTNQNKNKNYILAGNQANGRNETKDLIANKRELTQKRAMKLIGDAWDKDKGLAQKVKDLEQAKQNKLSEMSEDRSKISDIEQAKLLLREEYGVDPDSQEQKDLELLQKYQNSKAYVSDEEFTEEEIIRLRELQNEPRTEYQNKVLEQNAIQIDFKKDVRRKECEMSYLIEAKKIAENTANQSQYMRNANEMADSIKKAADDEVKGLLVKDSLEKIEEDKKEQEEKTEEIQEKKEEQISEEEHNRKDQEDIIKNATESDGKDLIASMNGQTTSSVELAQRSINRIMKENNLINEDLKGIEIDFNF